ncbi:hypothetical protein ACE10Z_41845 [Bradyrhizobium sp. Pha-3]
MRSTDLRRASEALMESYLKALPAPTKGRFLAIFSRRGVLIGYK